eukprot:6048765-Amphidinium_carterae.1
MKHICTHAPRTRSTTSPYYARTCLVTSRHARAIYTQLLDFTEIWKLTSVADNIETTVQAIMSANNKHMILKPRSIVLEQ